MSRFDAVDLSQLPAPNVVQPLDFEAILAARIADLSTRFAADPSTAGIVPLLQYEVDPSVKIQETGAYRELVHYNRVNDAARAVLVASAQGSDLDNLGALFGVVRLNGETDDRYRTRITLAPNAYSNAGPLGGLIYECMTASSNVLDVKIVKTPYTGQLAVYILSSEPGGVPSAATLLAVSQRLFQDDVKLMTDEISVNPATIVPYAVVATLTVPVGPDPALIQAAAVAAVQGYINGAYKLGGLVQAQVLWRTLFVANVAGVSLSAPAADIVTDNTQAPFCSNIAISVIVNR